MLALYNTLLHVGLVLGLVLWPLGLFSRRHPYRDLGERFTVYPPELRSALAGSRPIWIHAASVGEVRAAGPLVRRLRTELPDRKLLLSTMTATGRGTARDTLPELDGLTYLPLELPWLVSRSLRRFRPEIIILLETEIWPNFIHAARRLSIPVVVLSGRLSPRCARGYRRFQGLFGPVLKALSGFGMQDRENAGRVLSLGVEPAKVTVTGNLKYAETEPGSVPDPFGPERVPGPVVVAGSTHRGEEEVFLDILPELRRLHPELLLILAPRHPERFGEVERLLRERRLRYRKWIGNDEPGADAGVLLLNTLGELPRFYGCAGVAFVGGTLVAAGGHNLMEPARWGKPLLFGPHHSNIAETARKLLEQGGGVEVHDREELLRELSDLLADPARASSMGRRARRAVESDGDVVSRSMDLVRRQLSQE